MTLDRRSFLRWTAITAGAAAGAAACNDSDGAGPDGRPAGDDAGPTPDGGACRTTTSDLQGPFFEAGAPMRVAIASPEEAGERLVLEGTVLADDCVTPLSGALLDVWQADRTGAYHGGAEDQYRLRGQVTTDASGRFRVETIRPGNYQQPDGTWRPAHIHFTMSRPGYRLVTTQLYFAGDPYLSPNDGCPSCGSDDVDRIVELSGDATAGWTGTWQIVLARA